MRTFPQSPRCAAALLTGAFLGSLILTGCNKEEEKPSGPPPAKAKVAKPGEGNAPSPAKASPD